jgi:hypothetical protein
MKCDIWLKGQSKMLYVPSGCSATSKMNMKLLQVECLNFDETFATVARLESIRILLAYATHHGFKIYQMDVRSAFLNGSIKKEVYMEQPSGFKSEEHPNHVYKLHKVLYGLKQAPRV